MNVRAVISLALASAIGSGLASCSAIEADVESAVARPTPEALAEYLPVFEIEADDAALAEMLARVTEDIEIPATLSLRRGGGEVLRGVSCEIQVKGSASVYNPAVSLGVKLDGDRDNRDARFLSVPRLLGGHDVSRLRSVRLRNGGQDFSGTLVKDLAYARMLAETNAAVLPVYGEPACAFLNGAFYGLLNLRTETNANGVSRLTGIRKRDLLIAEVDTGADFDIRDGDPAPFRQLEADLRAGNRAAAMAAIDEESFADYLLIGSLFAVRDWPYRNTKVYGVAGAPLRFMAYDFDGAAEIRLDFGLARHLERAPDNPISRLFTLAMTDAGFRDRLWARQRALLASGALHPDRFRAIYADLVRAYDPVIAYQIAAYGQPGSRAEWSLNVETNIQAYARRYAYVLEHLGE